MKKIFTNKNFIQKIIISIIIVLLFSFSVPVKSQASLGGMLLDPLFDLVGTIFDVVTGALQMFLVDGGFGEGDDGGLLNIFMVSKGELSSHPELTPESGATVSKVIKESELDSNIFGNSTYYIPNIKYTPDKIFANKIPALDINFMKPSDWGSQAENDRSIAKSLHNIIASWYVSLRNLTVVGLMLVLLYVGIRIVISSTASDKSKYKQMLVDWVVALCLLFTLHYIMTFTVTIVQEISESISQSASDDSGNNIVVQIDGDNSYTFKTDLMGLIRFQMQYNEVGKKLLYLILYIAMVCYTCLFTFKYLKRVLIIAFLTLISPLVALTYPIDKIRDGKAQAFDLWLKEYVFNALEQPFHLIIYTVFVTTSESLIVNDPLIAIVALAFIGPAEKILRKFFGFDKAGTSGALSTFAGAAGGSAAYNMLSKAMRGKGGKNGSGGNGKNNNIRDKNQLKDPNAPSGVDGFTDIPLSSGDANKEEQPEGIDTMSQQQPEETNTMPQQPTDDNTQINRPDYEQNWKDYEAYKELMNEATDPEDKAWLEQQNLENQRDYMEKIENDKYGPLSEGRTLPESERPKTQIPAQESAQEPTQTPEQTPAQEPDQTSTQTPIHEMKERAGQRPKNKKQIKGVLGGFAGFGKGVAEATWTNRLGSPRWWRKVGRNTLRAGGRLAVGAVHTAGRVAAGTAVGAIGVGMGIAGGDLDDVFKFGAGGFALGASVGGNKINNAVDSVGRGIANSAPIQGFINGFTGTTSTQRRANRAREEAITNPEFIQNIQQEYMPNGRELQGKELRQATERAAQYQSYGIKDPAEIAKAMKLEDTAIKDLGETNLDEEAKSDRAKMLAAVATKKAQQIHDPTKLADDDYVQKLTKSYQREIQGKNPSLSPKDAEGNAKQLVKMVKQFHRIG